MARIPTSCPPVNAKAQMQVAIREAEASLRQTIALRLNEILLAVVCHVLSRPYHRRRQALPSWVVQEGICSRCKRQQSWQFSRNGFRPRQLLGRWGELNTVTYYHLLHRFPSWRRAYLRTTSRLERFNRRLRCCLRAAAAFHSDPGILAMVAQEAYAYHASQAHDKISTE